MRKVYKIKRKSDGKFWKPKRGNRPVFDFEGKEFTTLSAAKNSFISQTKDFGTGTVRPENPQLNPNDYEIIEYESRLIQIRKIKITKYGKTLT